LILFNQRFRDGGDEFEDVSAEENQSQRVTAAEMYGTFQKRTPVEWTEIELKFLVEARHVKNMS
jgi:hypothetical protein